MDFFFAIAIGNKCLVDGVAFTRSLTTPDIPTKIK